jgi:hypothetical protein
MPLNVNVAEEQQAPTTRQTIPGSRAQNAQNSAFMAQAGAGYGTYGNNPLFGRLPVRNLNAFDISTLDLLECDPLLALELLPLIFPDASLAVHNILRLGNPGWEIKCFHTVSGKEDKTGGRLCTDMMENANRGVDCQIPGAMGGPDALINSLLFNAYLKGACAVEAVLDETLTVLDDLVTVDPFSIYFEERKDKRGRYRIFQFQPQEVLEDGDRIAPVETMPNNGRNLSGIIGYGSTENKVELNPNLITYVPLDETLYGRSMVAPALQLLIFWTRFYIALQVFLHNVAFGDKDGEIDTALLLTLLDRNMTTQERRLWEKDFWGQLVKLVGIFADDYKNSAKKDPTSALIHSDLLKMSALGTARTAYPVEEVMKVCKREIYAALKMLPVFMGANDTVAETHATIQMQIFTSGLNYIQGAVKHAIERALLTGLQAGGYNKKVRVELVFKSLSLEDRKKLAEAIKVELQNEVVKRNEGFQTQDEASENATGSPAVCDGPNGEPAQDVTDIRPPRPMLNFIGSAGQEGEDNANQGAGGGTQPGGDGANPADNAGNPNQNGAPGNGGGKQPGKNGGGNAHHGRNRAFSAGNGVQLTLNLTAFPVAMGAPVSFADNTADDAGTPASSAPSYSYAINAPKAVRNGA